MTITVVKHNLYKDTQNLYDVTFFSNEILTLVTHSPSEVTSWISDIHRIHRRRLHNLVVGLDVEWRPSFGRHIYNRVATLQLCVGRRCLIFQLMYTSRIPQSLVSFLGNDDYTFVGVGIEGDARKLYNDYGLEVRNLVDLTKLAAKKMGNERLKNAGLKGLARAVLELEMEKPKNITLSRWDNKWLSEAQVKYACVDAFVSFEIGRVLNAYLSV